jgi:coenzyme F420-0:L-glutamate ligase / coenzyme F420-1:gamma-L-glutamate ligase
MTARLELFALPGLPMVRAGDDLPALILAGLARAGQVLRDRDVVVVAQKIVSKAEGRTIDLADVVPSAQAVALAAEVGKDPRIVEVVLSDSLRVVRSRPNLMIMQHRLGFVMANAGVDQSNVAEADGHQRALLLPLDPDGSAEAIRSGLAGHADVGVVISDSFGRPWRSGARGYPRRSTYVGSRTCSAGPWRSVLSGSRMKLPPPRRCCRGRRRRRSPWWSCAG